MADTRHHYLEPHLKTRNLVIDSIGYFFHHIKVPKTKFSPKYFWFLNIFVDLCSVSNFSKEKTFQLGKHKNNLKNWKRKKIVSVPITKIGPWFRFPIPKPGFGHSLYPNLVSVIHYLQKQWGLNAFVPFRQKLLQSFYSWQ